jgi:hypothetical protein
MILRVADRFADAQSGTIKWLKIERFAVQRLRLAQHYPREFKLSTLGHHTLSST